MRRSQGDTRICEGQFLAASVHTQDAFTLRTWRVVDSILAPRGNLVYLLVLIAGATVAGRLGTRTLSPRASACRVVVRLPDW